jgi:hypothetical protein
MTADLRDNGCRSANVFPVGVAFVARQQQRYAHVTVQNTTQIRTWSRLGIEVLPPDRDWIEHHWWGEGRRVPAARIEAV